MQTSTDYDRRTAPTQYVTDLRPGDRYEYGAAFAVVILKPTERGSDVEVVTGWRTSDLFDRNVRVHLAPELPLAETVRRIVSAHRPGDDVAPLLDALDDLYARRAPYGYSIDARTAVHEAARDYLTGRYGVDDTVTALGWAL